MIRVVLADDQALVRAGFRALLDAQADISVVGEAGDGAEAVSLCLELRPDVMLMDIRMPGVDGLEATRRIALHDALTDVRVVMLTTFDLDEHVFEALRWGASGFLVKDTEPVDLLRAVRIVADGEALLTPSVTRRLIAEFASLTPRTTAGALEELTEREREVVSLVALGRSNDEIAEALVISPATAKTHVSRAMLKTGARDRAQLVVLAYQSGLVVPPRGVGASVVRGAMTRRGSVATVCGMLKPFRKVLLLVHITGSVALLGATASSLLLAIVAASNESLSSSAYELMSLQALVFGIPLSFIALGSGIAVGFAGKWGVLRYRWTAAKLVLMVAVILNGAFVLGPTTAARIDGAGSAWGLVAGEVLQVVLLLIPMWLSVYKPGGRLRRAQAARVIATR